MSRTSRIWIGGAPTPPAAPEEGGPESGATTDGVSLSYTLANTAQVEGAFTQAVQAGFTVTAEVIAAATGLNNVRISAMHFQKIWEPIAVGD